MPLYRVVAAYRTDAQEILLVLEHGETIYRVEGEALVPFHVTQSSALFMPLFESRRAHGARSHGPESLKPLPGLDVS